MSKTLGRASSGTAVMFDGNSFNTVGTFCHQLDILSLSACMAVILSPRLDSGAFIKDTTEDL